MDSVGKEDAERSPSVHAGSGSSSNSSDSESMNGAASIKLSALSREPLSMGSSPTLVVPEESLTGMPNVTFMPIIDTGSVRLRAGDSAELSSDAADRSTTTNSSHSPAAVNPLRSMNPAFSLSPRTASSSGFMHLSSIMPSVTIHTDKEKPPASYSFAVGTVEGRRNFITDCLRLAEYMSPQMIVEELLPSMLMVVIYDDSVCAIARVLPGVVKQVHGLNEDIFMYFMGLIMHMCCAADHEVVRQISTSLEEIMLYVSDSIAESLLLPLMMSMRVSFWSSPRAVSAALMGTFAARPCLVKASGMTVMEWFNCFIELARDKCHFVREIAASSLHQWVPAAEVHRVNLAEMPLPLVHECMMDEQSDAVRYMHVAELVRLAGGIGKEATTKYLQLPFIASSKDLSWRVRYTTAKNLGAFARLCVWPDDLLDVFIALCNDENKDIRAVVVEQLSTLVSKVVSQEVLRKMCAVATSLAKDEEPAVRESVANFLHVLLSPDVVEVYTHEQRQALFALLADNDYVVGRSAARSLEQVVLGLAEYMCPGKGNRSCGTTTGGKAGSKARRSGRHGSGRSQSDYGNNNTSPQVTTSTTPSTTAAISSVEDDECKKRAAEIISGLIDHLHIVSDSKNWRIREAVVGALRYFCAALTEEEFIPLTYIIRSLLRDPVSVVRARAVETLSEVATSYGPEWAAVMAFDLLRREFVMGGETPYTWRVVAIQSLSGILPVVDGLSPMDLRRYELMQQWMRVMMSLSEDPVSNVRLALANSIVARWEWYKGCCNHRDTIRCCVERLQRDSDVDVLNVAGKLDTSTMGREGEPF
ncbi:protein phosphatase 2A regulatory subunit [Trypanosoma grayi]|uniref:protein phosphatase 2A regulatory subunit n=1 Tax=Trypanosoma grayi TaxID=71804 RepID=UPI0004F3F318|nr:protein phosphatase 2A regulatory subunit [Trypanosoma grayi]KEG12633.1 protein phosphatase 2A regulatory subunit [Trypanosoma grayi]